MTPKEKAKELISKYIHLTKQTNGANGTLYNSKQCALIAVDFHLKEFEDWANITCCGETFSWKYWQEVKEEIEKL